MTVAIAAPLIPKLNPNIKSGSKTRLATAPIAGSGLALSVDKGIHAG